MELLPFNYIPEHVLKDKKVQNVLWTVSGQLEKFVNHPQDGLGTNRVKLAILIQSLALFSYSTVYFI